MKFTIRHEIRGRIRVHMAHIGHPLAGDDLYGGRRELIGRQALHCAKLWFDDPTTGKQVLVESPLPSDMQELMERLRPGGRKING